MTLAIALNKRSSAVRADFQQFYGLNIDNMGSDFSTLHAADLLVELPDNSRVKMMQQEGGSIWTFDRMLAALCVDALNTLVWMQTKDGHKNRNRPKSLIPKQKQKSRQLEAVAMSIDELDAILHRPRGGENNG